MQRTAIMKSAIDASVNIVFEGNFPGFFEARYVRRDPEYFVVYISSQSGCAKACRMCHLTQTRQTHFADARPEDIAHQARAILRWYDRHAPPAQTVHFNFMARGEPFENKHILSAAPDIYACLEKEALRRNLAPRYCVSTIMPASIRGKRIGEITRPFSPDIYYSLYSVRDAFRKRWLPNALPAAEALTLLKEYQQDCFATVKLHWAFIEGENDSEADVRAIAESVAAAALRADINIVRYNPPVNLPERESPEHIMKQRVELLQRMLPSARVRIIPRVGFDVQASCGMFVEKRMIPFPAL